MMPEFPFDAGKFRELLVYIAEQTKSELTFGSTKLNKVLYYADFSAYRQFGQPITGATYQKLPDGPAPRELLAERQYLIGSGDVVLKPVPHFTGTVKHLVAERSPNREMFDHTDLLLVDGVIKAFDGKTAREVSDFSHREPGWLLANTGETIPYETAWLSGEPIEQEAWEQARSFANARIS